MAMLDCRMPAESSSHRSAYVQVDELQEEDAVLQPLARGPALTSRGSRTPALRRAAAAVAVLAGLAACLVWPWRAGGRQGSSSLADRLQVKVQARRGGHGAEESNGSCRNARVGDECYEGVVWAMQTGIYQNPHWYPGLTPSSSFKEFQAHLHKEHHHHCARPCHSEEEEGERKEFVVSQELDNGDDDPATTRPATTTTEATTTEATTTTEASTSTVATTTAEATTSVEASTTEEATTSVEASTTEEATTSEASTTEEATTSEASTTEEATTSAATTTEKPTTTTASTTTTTEAAARQPSFWEQAMHAIFGIGAPAKQEASPSRQKTQHDSRGRQRAAGAGRQESSCWAVEEDFDYPGGNLRVAEDVASVDDCCKQCRMEDKCRQWTYNATRGTCALKHQLQVGRTHQKGLSSGMPGRDRTLYQIKGNFGFCLDAGPDNLQTASCVTSREYQLWAYDRGTGEIYSKHGSCLDAPNREGGAVSTRPCSSRMLQHWEFDSASGLIRSSRGHCLTAPSRLDGPQQLQLVRCGESNKTQRWSMAGPGVPEESHEAGAAKKQHATEPTKSPALAKSTAQPTTQRTSTTKAPSATREEQPIFQLIKKGTCEEAGMMPITTKVTCELAASVLKLKEVQARPTSNEDRPEGCYMFEMDMLWFSLNPKCRGRGWQPYRDPICMRQAPPFEPEAYRDQEGASIGVGGELKIYGVGSSNLVWMSWIDQLHLYFARLGYKLPLIDPHAILSRVTPRSVPICDDSAYYAKTQTARLGMVGWNSWDFAYNNWDDCDKDAFRNISGHKVKCGVGPGCKGGEFLISASSIAEDAAKSNITIVSTWYNDHKAFLTHYDCFAGEELRYEKTAEVTIPSILRVVKEIHKRNPHVAILVMGLYPPTLEWKVVEAEIPWTRRLNSIVREAVEKEPNTYFVNFELPGGDLEMYDRVHYGHPNCRGAKVMVHAALQRLYEAKVLARSTRLVDPKVNIANPNCHLMEDAATCDTSALCWVDPAEGKCKPYSSGHKAITAEMSAQDS